MPVDVVLIPIDINAVGSKGALGGLDGGGEGGKSDARMRERSERSCMILYEGRGTECSGSFSPPQHRLAYVPFKSYLNEGRP